ncbi:MAG: hypothetical protein LCH46_03550 [Proteobacteria bacterium]|nr:hypothetical protein [Pseudomonadota bacterium]
MLPLQAIPGFVCAYAFDAHGTAEALTEHDVARLAGDEDGWFWLHLNLTDQRCGRWLSEDLGVAKGVTEAFCEPQTYQSLQQRGPFRVGHMPDFRRDFDANSTEHAWLHVIGGPRFLVTGRTRAVRSAETIRSEISRGTPFANPDDLLFAMISNYPDTLDETLQRLLEELEVIEDHILDDRHRGERRRLMIVRREAAQLHRHMRALRRTLSHAERTISDLPAGAAAIVQRLTHLDQDFDSLESRARFFHDEIDAKLSAETNRQLYILSCLTAGFLPPALVAGLFGMNLPDMPWAGSAHGFWIAAGLCALSSAAVGLFLWRANRN